MKLLTHNFLSSKFLKGAVNGYPLKLRVVNKKVVDSEYDRDFLINIMSKLEIKALKQAADDIGEGANLPESFPDVPFEQLPEELLQELHRLLFCIDIIEGELECPDTQRKFPIKDGIPNMLCDERECT